MISNKTNPIVG
uniref:Uncharacterized protein n=1 Tax=Arundo donax TaxID=35708 RepID=A0A0A9B495_ARUDO